MNILLHPKNEAFIREQLEKGKYSDIDEVINEAVELLRLLCKRKEYAVEGEQVGGRSQQKHDGERSMMSLEEMRKMIGTDKPA